MFRSFISRDLQTNILQRCTPVSGVSGMLQHGSPRGFETPAAFQFLAKLHDRTTDHYSQIMKQRIKDREFIDKRTKELVSVNSGIDYLSSEYRTIVGEKDKNGRIVVGPLREQYYQAVKGTDQPVANLPPHLQGPHVTLFGPPDTAKLSINAVNCMHRRLSNEPPVVEKLVEAASYSAKWGADDEDSKTPLRRDLVDAAVNLNKCYDGSLAVDSLTIADKRRALPIKRIPGLALPCMFLFYKDEPVPLHLYDLVIHLASNHKRGEALSIYFPKLENEEEAAYLGSVLREAESILQKDFDPSYKTGTIRVCTVIENPRALFRLNEIIDALHPYFFLASVGWHDACASTCRLHKEDENFRIPVKADPNIVVKYIKMQHHLISDIVGPRGGVPLGGMYGILPVNRDVNSKSFQVTMKGFFVDVLVQLSRGLNGFWIAHPDFVRVGVALVEAYRRREKDPKDTCLEEIISGYMSGDEVLRQQVLNIIDKPDPVEKVCAVDQPKSFARKLTISDIQESDFIANHDPEEVRYNLFQCLQYMADWLLGRGCVALPASIGAVRVRVMDDLATTERSRWEVWHEVHYNRISRDAVIQIAKEEFDFIKENRETTTKAVQVKYDESTKKWYDVAFKLTVKLMTDEQPREWVTEMLLPFTVPEIREAEDPWSEAQKTDAEKYAWN